MDYKYIEQLLERYWQCQTSLEEEAILRSFFSQEYIPARLRPYKSLFACERQMGEIRLGDDFDAKVLAQMEDEPVKARPITLSRRLMPLYKAAASIAILLTLGTAAQTSLGGAPAATDDYNYSNYEDTYNDPEVAYDQVSDALKQVSACLSNFQDTDTISRNVAPGTNPVRE